MTNNNVSSEVGRSGGAGWPQSAGMHLSRTMLVCALAACVAGCKSTSLSGYISPRVEGRVVDDQSHAPISGVRVHRVSAHEKVAEPQKGGQLMESGPVVVKTGQDGSFALDSERDVAFLRKVDWYSVSIAFEHPGYRPLTTTYTSSNATNAATGEPVVKAGTIQMAPLSR
jgi:hypothetical protein